MKRQLPILRMDIRNDNPSTQNYFVIAENKKAALGDLSFACNLMPYTTVNATRACFHNRIT